MKLNLKLRQAEIVLLIYQSKDKEIQRSHVFFLSQYTELIAK